MSIERRGGRGQEALSDERHGSMAQEASPAPTVRATALFNERMDANYRRTSRVFTVLMIAQWLLGIIVALVWSPYAWSGRAASIHVHVWAAVFLGAAISSLPIVLTITRPTATSTRFVVAVAQMLWSALLIHLSGGRIETHFHIFASLAFLAFYGDWRILIPATLLVGGDHLVRGLWWPESVFGVANAEWWRFLEHAFWVVCEDVVLVFACLRTVRETRFVADRQAEVELSLGRVSHLNQDLDRRVGERTHELSEANGQLSANLERLNRMQQELVQASRQAGMAEVATAVLHNVGNVLNSVNISAGVIADVVRRSKSSGLEKLGTLLSQPDFETLLGGHAKGKSIPVYVTQLAIALRYEQYTLIQEAEGLQNSIDHIKAIVSKQQTHAKGTDGTLEVLPLRVLVADAVKMSGLSKAEHHIELVYDLATLPATLVNRHKVCQILLNFLNNARHAIVESGRGGGRVTIRQSQGLDGAIRLEVEDNGCGIRPENLKKIFSHGFTTRKDGHGFGLHSSACAAAEMGGRLSCRSDGPGRGSVFTLELFGDSMDAAA
jgi:signal transduction histidine kinase